MTGIAIVAMLALASYFYFRTKGGGSPGGGSPAMTPEGEASFFDVLPTGERILKPTLHATLFATMGEYAFVYVKGDDIRSIEAVPKTPASPAGVASTTDWINIMLQKGNVVYGVRWILVPSTEPRKFLFASPDVGAREYAKGASEFAILMMPGQALGASAPGQSPGYPAPGLPAPGYGAPGYPAPGYPPSPGYGAPPGYPAPGYGAPPGMPAPASMVVLDKSLEKDPALRQLILDTLETQQDVKKLRLMADQLDSQGYPLAAKAMRDKADQLEKLQGFQGAMKGYQPFIIRPGDLPSTIAAKASPRGASSWREILPLNTKSFGPNHPALSEVSKQGTVMVQPWKGGQEIYVPLDWNMAQVGPPPSVDKQGNISVKNAPAPAQQGPTSPAVWPSGTPPIVPEYPPNIRAEMPRSPGAINPGDMTPPKPAKPWPFNVFSSGEGPDQEMIVGLTDGEVAVFGEVEEAA